MSAWIDVHNHLQDHRLSDLGVEAATLWESGVEACVVNATGEDDWSAVATLAAENPGRVRPAYGVHPWKAGGVTAGWLQRLEDLLVADPTATVGEIGLDRWVEAPGIDVQRPVFINQLRLARLLDRVATIHCLKAWGPLFEVFEDCPPPPRFLMHSFNGSLEVAERLLARGAYFSFSGYFLHPRKAGLVEVFRQLPKDRILLETDAPDMLPPPALVAHALKDGLNHPANLHSIGCGMAEALGMTADEMRQVSRENALRFLGG